MKKVKILKPVLLIIIALLFLLGDYLKKEESPSTTDKTKQQTTATQATDILAAMQKRAEKAWVSGSGTIVAILEDDTQGSQHQRIVITVKGAEQTVLIAHNIDIAPRIAEPQPGDKLRFTGEYIWNAKGGIVHWTHHDPGGRHPGGWLEKNGTRYQ